MSYIEKELADGEELITLSRPSWWTIVPRTLLAVAVIGVVLVILGLTPYLTAPIVGFGVLPIGLVIWLVMVVPLVVRILGTEIAITNRRVTSKTGILNVEVKTTPLDKVNNVNVTQSLPGRMFHYGDLEVTTATAEMADNHVVHKLAHPNAFRNELTALTDGQP